MHINRTHLIIAGVAAWLLWEQIPVEWGSVRAQPPAEAAVSEKLGKEIEELQQQMARLKGVVPDQAHAMADVGYHYANLWFTGREENWPLAQFYLNEVRSHLHWAVRIIPVRKDAKGNDIRLADILAPIEAGNLKQLGDTIAAKDRARFEPAYRRMMDSCYACHLLADKPFIRLRIPERPESPMIDFKPADESANGR